MTRSTVTLSCLQCGVPFTQRCAELSRSADRGQHIGKFCSRTCSGAYKTNNRVPKPANCRCQVCGKVFYRNKTKMKNSRSGLTFCSRKCKDRGQEYSFGLKAIWPGSYKVGKHVHYRSHALKHYGAKCKECDFSIAAVLIVHHTDGDRNNNAMGNLEVLCPNHHALRHYKNGRYNTKFI